MKIWTIGLMVLSLISCWGCREDRVRFQGNRIMRNDSVEYSLYKKEKGKIVYDSNIIVSADVNTFTYITYRYSKDKNNVYFGSERFSVADPGSFEVLNFGYSKDRTHVYCENDTASNLIEGADPLTFEPISLEFSKDRNRVYHLVHLSRIVKLVGIDVATFRGYPDHSYYYSDTNFLYDIDGAIIAKRDTFDIGILGL